MGKGKKKNQRLTIKPDRTIAENGVKKTKWEPCKKDYYPKTSRQDLERVVRQPNLRHESELKRAKEAREHRELPG